MISLFNALAPVFLLIFMGYGLRRQAVVPDAFWPPVERLTYFIFFPALIIDELCRADLGDLNILPMASAMIGAVLLTGLGMVSMWRRLCAQAEVDGPGFSSVFQGAIRPNTYVGLAAAGALYGSAGLTLTAIGIATVVPLVNILAVLVLTRFGAGKGSGVKDALTALSRNPIIVAVAIGTLFNASGSGVPPVIGPVCQILGKAALPVGLLAVGAGLDLGAAKAAGLAMAQSSIVKLLLLPGLTALLGKLMEVQGLTLTIAVLFNALPASASSYVLARQMGGDHRLIAGIITAQTMLAALTLPVALLAFTR